MSDKKKVFIDGEITPDFIASAIAKHQSKTDIGAHNIFLGQVRADVIEGQTVSAIDIIVDPMIANPAGITTTNGFI